MGDIKQDIRDLFYHHVRLSHKGGKGSNEPRWRGTCLIKFPTDLILYEQAIYDNKPDVIVETGTKFGGSALFFADMLSLFVPGGRVISIDNQAREVPQHPLIEYIVGSSTGREIIEDVTAKVAGKRVMVVLDSNHSRIHVKWELHHYGRIVTPGQFLVVEDCWTRNEKMKGPGQAVEWFLSRSRRFKREAPEDQFFVAVTRGGWLRRVR